MIIQEKSQFKIHKESLSENLKIAFDLRNQNKTYSEIAKIMDRPDATIRRWLAPYRVKIDSSNIKKLDAIKKGRETMLANYAKLRIAAYEEGKKSAEVNFKDPMFRDFINLYIGEGSKRNRGGLQITNSDPYILFPAYLVMKKYFLKENKNMVLNIAYYTHSHDIEKLKKFWTNIFKEQNVKITTSVQPTGKPHGHNNSNKYGLCRLSIDDTYAKQRLDACIDYLKQEWIATLEKEVGCKVVMDK